VVILTLIRIPVLLVEETGIPGGNIDLSQVTDKLYHIMLYRAKFEDISGDKYLLTSCYCRLSVEYLYV
jgi:hypothetical protein